MEKIRIGGVMQNGHLSLLNVTAVPDRPGTAAAILCGLGDRSINVQFIVQCIDQLQHDQIALCVDRNDLDVALEIVRRIAPALEAGKVLVETSAAVVSIFGPDFRERPGIAGIMFRALSARGVNILAISTSISTVSCVINALDLEDALTAVRQSFELP